MKVVVGSAALALALAIMVGAGVAVRALARRVVGVEPRRELVTVRRVGDGLELPRSDLTIVEGMYGLWFGERFQQHAMIGPVVYDDGGRVVRRVLASTMPLSTELFQAQWTGHFMGGPHEVDPNWEDVVVPLRDGGESPAWLFRGTSSEGPWVIHVQGIRTSRLVTLRSVQIADRVGLTSLVISYRGSGDGPPRSASTLGQREWTDLADAISYARLHGATAVYVVAWSMGAGLALELLRNDPVAFERLALISPATNWRGIIRHGVRTAGLPTFVARCVTWVLGSRGAGAIVGVSEPLNFDRLNWCRGLALGIPTVVIHSRGDDSIPFDLTQDFAAMHSNATLVETSPAPHGWEANVDPDAFGSALTWLLSAAGTDVAPEQP
ncbi:alpha/beta hydrolase family protein [Microbacterium hominis]|uniref:Alpha/beta hydrolase n=1 Tax=Microbacterium hominis TaxID=162426 RepID=A0A7D4UAX9_9MICO|nr:hypothetical protein [Microbacterium hominis]QKJ18903.1 hypothetical protein HQM25_05585 [Microbacterium hominis]